MLKDIYNPLSIFVAALCAITTAVVLNEQDIDWIHSVWVVMGVALLVDFEPRDSGRLVKLFKKIFAVIIGLAIGILSGLIVLGLNSWDAPAWSMAVIRVLFATSIPFGLGVLMTKKNIFENVENVHFALICAFLAPPLFATSRSQAFARVVGVLFACGVVALVSVVFWVMRPASRLRTSLAENASLFDATLSLCIASIQCSPEGKEEFTRLTSNIGINQEILMGNSNFFGATILSSSAKVSGALEGIVANLRPLVADAAGLFWTTVSVSNAPVLQTTQPIRASTTRFGGSMIDLGSNTDKYGYFCQTETQFKEYFSNPIVRIENGLEIVRVDLLNLLADSGNMEVVLGRIVHEGVGFFMVDGMEALQTAFTKHSEGVFPSESHRQAMANYLINLSAMMVSLIGFIKTVIDAIGLGDEFPHLSSNLIDSMRKIASQGCKNEQDVTRENTEIEV